MNVSDFKLIAETIQNIISTVAILIAGLWSFYIFILGRSYSPHVQIIITPIYTTSFINRQGYVVLKIKAKNVGRTKATKNECYLAIEKVVPPITKNEVEIQRIDSAVNFDNAKVYSVFDDHTILEPNEEIFDEIMMVIDRSSIFKVKAIWYGDKFLWSSNFILHKELERLND